MGDGEENMIERQVFVTWYKPEEKLPLTDEIVIVTASGKIANVAFDHTFAIASYCEGEGWWLDCAENEKDMDELTVHAWCDLEPYGKVKNEG